jgi:hypothetical protein
MAKKPPSIHDLVMARLERAYQSSNLGRSAKPGQVTNIPTPAPDLIPAFEYFSNQIAALEEIVLVLSSQVDKLQSE